MKYALNLAENNRILSATYEEFATDGASIVDELPEGDIANYLYVDDQYKYDPLPEPEQPEPEVSSEDPVWDELDAAYQEGVDSV